MNRVDALACALEAVANHGDNNCTLVIETKDGPLSFPLGRTGICHGPTGQKALTGLLQALIEDSCITLAQLRARALHVLKQSRGESTGIEPGDPRCGPNREAMLMRGPGSQPQRKTPDVDGE